MAFVETIARKFVDQVEKLVRPVGRNRMRCAARDEAFPLGIHFGLNLLTHCTTKQICFPKAVAGQNLRGLHNLFLVNKYSVGFVQHGLKQGVRIFDAFFTIFTAAKHGNIVHWTRTIERHERDDVTKIGWFHRRKRAAHAFGFQLENAYSVTPLQQFIYCGVIMRQ